MNRCNFGAIGLEVKAVQRESDSEQRTLGFLFEDFWPSKEVILFLESHNLLILVLEFFMLILGYVFVGF